MADTTFEEFKRDYLREKPDASPQEILSWWALNRRIAADSKQPGHPDVKNSNPPFEYRATVN